MYAAVVHKLACLGVNKCGVNSDCVYVELITAQGDQIIILLCQTCVSIPERFKERQKSNSI